MSDKELDLEALRKLAQEAISLSFEAALTFNLETTHRLAQMGPFLANALLAALDRIDHLVLALELGEQTRAGLEAHNDQDRTEREQLRARVDELEKVVLANESQLMGLYEDFDSGEER
jgi:hypothetical protein